MGSSGSSSSDAQRNHRWTRDNHRCFAYSKDLNGAKIGVQSWHHNFTVVGGVKICKAPCGGFGGTEHMGLVLKFQNLSGSTAAGVSNKGFVWGTLQFGTNGSWVIFDFFKDDNTRTTLPQSGEHIAVQMIGKRAWVNEDRSGYVSNLNLANIITIINGW
eukprot:CAMPEP_0197025796 /NCGR_PEP_ID=MMETSP1384-20130603/6016_1 /TAXON_ID=29189 /ORGANISM="Ammonia sp." /LENGTH=158 /DNA_ID=CAMNT_0042454367 /DNA_START=213 /DNA_END=686 /DNA_ORIENTATION=-